MQKRSGLFEKLSKYLFAAILVIVPLFPKFPLISVSGTYVAIRFDDILLLILGIFVLIKVVPNLKSFFRDKIVSAFLIFFIVGLLSLISAAFVTETIDLKIGLLHLFRRVEYFIPFVAAITLFSKENITGNLRFFLKIIVVVTIVSLIYGLGQRYLRFPMIITQNAEYSKGVALFWTPGAHINSTFAGHYDLAAVMVFFLSIFITSLLLLKDGYSRLMLFLSSAAGLWLLINSVSRIAQVSYLLAIGLSLFLVKKFKAMGLVIMLSLVLIGMSSNLATRFGRIFEVYYQKLNIGNILSEVKSGIEVMASDVGVITPTPAPVFEDRSTSIRLNVEWPRAIRALKKNFILGTGYSSINLATDNDYLRLLGEVGVLGFSAFALLFLRIFKDLFRAFPLHQKLKGLNLGFMSGTIGGLAGTFLIAFFIDVFEASKFAIIFWALLGTAVFMARNIKYVQNK